MNETYRVVLERLKTHATTLEGLQTLEPGNAELAEAVLCLTARGLIRWDPTARVYRRDEEAITRELEVRR